MSGFKALNVDSESEEEIDDTKEIQTEEAFKLYQNALKLHSQGPLYYDEAREAYDELFSSELFKYPEALSEFSQESINDPPTATVLPTEIEPVAALPSNTAESAANSIPHLVYLAHKNRGQFELDEAHHRSQAPLSDEAAREFYAKACELGLINFADGLERDDTDIDLWKKAARVAEVLSIPRIARFCLESVLAGDDDSAQTIDLSGLDEAFAAGELRDFLKLLQDDLSCLRAAGIHPKPFLLRLLQTSNDSYPFLPKRNAVIVARQSKEERTAAFADSITLTANTIFGLGDELHKILIRHLEGDSTVSARATVNISHSGVAVTPPVGTNGGEVDDMIDNANGKIADAKEAGDVVMTDSSDQPANNPLQTVESPIEMPTTTALPSEVAPIRQTTELPNRKRSSAAAGNEEPEGRVKSKRLRARESMVEVANPEEEMAPEPPSHQSWNWSVLKAADADMLKTADQFLHRLELPEYGAADQLWKDANDQQMNRETSFGPGSDLCAALKSWKDDHSQAVIHGHGNQEFNGKSAGLTLFNQHLRVSQDDEIAALPTQHSDDLSRLTEVLSKPDMTIRDAVFNWFLAILTSEVKDGKLTASSYLREAWPAEEKKLTVQLLIRAEDFLVATLEKFYSLLTDATSTIFTDVNVRTLAELALTIFELHIDIHSRINNPSSQVSHAIRVAQMDRLERWAELTDRFIRVYNDSQFAIEPTDDLLMRFLWATTTYAGKADDSDRAFVITGLQDLRRILQEYQIPPIALPNNAAIPLISATAAEQELFRLSTLDFFMSVFDSDNDDSVTVIEKLEPIMEADVSASGELPPDSEEQRLIQFLNSGDASLRLFLWRRLQNAYTTISYTPKVVSCLFRAFETIVKEIERLFSEPSDEATRQITLLKWLKDADEHLSKILSKVSGESNALEAIDEFHLRSSLTAVTYLLKVVHVHALYEDQVRFAMVTPPSFKGAASARLYEKSKDRLREMHVHLWCAQYLLLKEATEQYSEIFPDAANDLADYLCTTHHALGQRHYCRYANKQLVRLVKSELSSLKTTNNYLGDMAQVMFDLYELRFKNTEGDFEHGCSAESLDKKTAIALIPMVMTYAKQIPMKDLLKSELRNTIEKVQAASGTVKSSPTVLQNRKAITTYLKSQLIPEKFYKAFKGQGGLVTKPIEDDDSIKAKYGWYFLLGHITLAKFRSVKRVSPTPTDDLDTAATLLRQDLEHDLEKWETWWRLAQIYEAKIEDDLIWNASKLNDSRADIAQIERHAIHCFLMAMTIAMRTSDDDADTAQKIQDMFREFAIRLYASSRPPLSMEAFKTDKTIRHLSNLHDQSMSKVPSRAPWTTYQLWKFAAGLLRKTFVSKPKPWTAHYYLHKCLWKIFQSDENQSSRHPVRASDVIDSLLEAIAALPRTAKLSDSILEPHIRLVSVLHKLVRMNAMTPHEGVNAMEGSRFGSGLLMAEDEDGPDWDQYLLNILRNLSRADKANWQHRIFNRAAHVIYDSEQNIAGALGAKHEFTQQIFTKTMTYQVWKPEHERAGRHYVYTGQYVTFFAHLLDQLQDRTNLDQLIRKVRRKYTDFINHTQIWEHLATTYVRLLRRIGKIPEGRERALFDNISFEEFSRLSEKLESWALDIDTSSVVLDIMRDAIDLKKLNNSLLKGGIIDDLIGDAYACLYDAYVSQLKEADRAPPPPVIDSGTSFINITSDGVDSKGAIAEQGLGITSDSANQTPSHQFVGSDLATPGPPARAVPPNKPGRAKTITRREVQRKAEAAIAKPPPIKTPTLSKRPIIEIALHSRRGDDSRDGDEESRLNSAATSRRGSIAEDASRDGENDDEDREAGNEADDESDLSDAADSEDGDTVTLKSKTPLFPNLIHGGRLMDGAGSDADDDDETEDENGSNRDEHVVNADDDAEQSDADRTDDAAAAAQLAQGDDDVDMDAEDHHGDEELEIPESQDVAEGRLTSIQAQREDV